MDSNNVFEGGFLGLDNISVFDRSQPLPQGYSLQQADATGWMAMFALNITIMALEMTTEDPDFEDMAIQTYEQFMAIANAISGGDDQHVPLWDEQAGFFKDLVLAPDGQYHHIDVYSWVGLIPLFACEVVDRRLLANAPRFEQLMEEHRKGLYDGHYVCADPTVINQRGEHLLALVGTDRLVRILERLLNEDEFLSLYGVRSVSKLHDSQRDLGVLPGVGQIMIEYVPGESTSGLFGGNSNWRGPVWMPTNYTLVQTLEKYHRFLGEDFKVPVSCMEGTEMNLREIATLISERLVNIFRRDKETRQIPAFPPESPYQSDPNWRDLMQFYEYFHGNTGLGLGAAHQTGWTGLVANLVMRKHRQDIPTFWREQSPSSDKASAFA